MLPACVREKGAVRYLRQCLFRLIEASSDPPQSWGKSKLGDEHKHADLPNSQPTFVSDFDWAKMTLRRIRDGGGDF